MLLYHFTCKKNLPAIKREGLTRGEVPISATFCLNAVVWLTTSKNPNGHGLSQGKNLSKAQKASLGLPADAKLKFADKTAVRITLDCDPSQVVEWLPWARERLDPQWLKTMTQTGGGWTFARTWYLSFEPIPPEAFSKIEILR